MLLLKTVNLSVEFFMCGQRGMIYENWLLAAPMHHAFKTLIYLYDENNNQRFGSFFFIFHGNSIISSSVWWLSNESNSISMLFAIFQLKQQMCACVWYSEFEILVFGDDFFLKKKISTNNHTKNRTSDKRRKSSCLWWKIWKIWKNKKSKW